MREDKVYTKDDIIQGMQMPGRKCWQHPDRKEAAPSTGRPKGEVGSKYPFPKMEVGDCFVAGAYDELLQQRVIGGAAKWAGMWSPETKFITRGFKGLLFCWRVK